MVLAAVEFAAQIGGWMSRPELEWLSDTASKLERRAVWCEVGAWLGRSWSCVALSLPPNSTIIAVDTFLGNPGQTGNYVKLNGPALQPFIQTHEQVRALRPDLTSQVIVGYSVSAARLVPDDICDVVFLDANHSMTAMLADTRAWMPKLKPGGLMCGHDADESGVIEALAGYRYNVVVGSIWRLV